jgi:hypothetical protein
MTMTKSGWSRALRLLTTAAHAAAATPEVTPLAGLEPEYPEPQRRRELLAGRFDSIERKLSLYREEPASLQISVDGIPIAESATGALL